MALEAFDECTANRIDAGFECKVAFFAALLISTCLHCSLGRIKSKAEKLTSKGFLFELSCKELSFGLCLILYDRCLCYIQILCENMA